jgi:hypothetical protein
MQRSSVAHRIACGIALDINSLFGNFVQSKSLAMLIAKNALVELSNDAQRSITVAAQV